MYSIRSYHLNRLSFQSRTVRSRRVHVPSIKLCFSFGINVFPQDLSYLRAYYARFHLVTKIVFRLLEKWTLRLNVYKYIVYALRVLWKSIRGNLSVYHCSLLGNERKRLYFPRCNEDVTIHITMIYFIKKRLFTRKVTI